MSEPNHCPECGAELPSGALEGLCPKCLMAAGFPSGEDQDHLAGGESAPTTAHPARFVPPGPAELAAYFPQLEILELLGHGGMGAVYKARQPRLDRLVALKIIRPESADTPAFAERFNREARMLARLNHPQIVAVYDFGEVNVSDAATPDATHPLYFFLMEYVDGPNLRQLMGTGGLTPQQALAIVPQICEALQFAHDDGVVHRDIKPENILLDKRGRVKIADFGLAKLAAGSPDDFTLTGTQQVMGTPRYMAPEQMEGSHAVDHRADIFSLGVVFYEMLTGEVPAGHFDPPSKKVEVDVRLDEVVLRALAREPKRRYQQASDVKSDVESISSGRLAFVAAPGDRNVIPPRSSAAVGEQKTGRPIRRLVLLSTLVTVFVVGAGSHFLGYKPFFLDISGALESAVMVLAFLGFLIDIVRNPGQPKGLRAAFALSVGLAAMLGAIFATPQVLLDWLYQITGGSPGQGDVAFLRVMIGLLVTWLIWQLVQIRKKLATLERGEQTSAEKPDPRYQQPGAAKSAEAAASSAAPFSRTLPPERAAGPGRKTAADDTDIAAARQLVHFPAIGLLVIGSLCVGLVTVVALATLTWAFGYPARGGLELLIGVTSIIALVTLPTAMIIGAVKMLRLSSYSWAVGASILAISPIPAGPLWLLSLPLGIWSLVVLSKPEVRRGFTLAERLTVGQEDTPHSASES